VVAVPVAAAREEVAVPVCLATHRFFLDLGDDVPLERAFLAGDCADSWDRTAWAWERWTWRAAWAGEEEPERESEPVAATREVRARSGRRSDLANMVALA
jgi:hypothetical protein